jgi:hypothetical protein
MTAQDSAGGLVAPDILGALAGRPALLEDACQRALAYLGTLPERRVAPAADMHFSPQSSQRARGVEVWAVLATFGRDGVAKLVDFGDPARTNAVIAAVQQEGTCWCGPTTWRGRQAMRVSVSSWNTTEDDVDQSIDAIRASALR